MNEQKKDIKTNTQGPFAVLQVPEGILGELVNAPNIALDLERIIGVKVLVMSQDVRLLQGSYAREEVDRIHKEIEAFLVGTREPSEMTVEELKAEIERLENERGDLRKQVGRLCIELARRTCPYSVGDVMVSRHGERAVITQINGAAAGITRGPFYLMEGHYLKKDGTPAMNPGRYNKTPRLCGFAEWDEWRKEGDAHVRKAKS